MTVSIEARGAGEWTVRATRGRGAEATCEVVLKQAAAPDASTPHARLAGACAWLRLGRVELAAGRADEAHDAAREGLAELGAGYASPDVADDTDLKLLAADDLRARGRRDDAAALALRMLDTRTRLYAELHRDAIAQLPEPPPEPARKPLSFRETPVRWKPAADANALQARVGPARWRLEPRADGSYTLFVDGNEIERVSEWPPAWKKD